MDRFKNKLKMYWSLIKSLQTGLLVITGITGYFSAKCPVTTPSTFFLLTLSLFLAVSGSTVLNMVWDRDIDAKMKRTERRPMASNKMNAREGWILGLILSVLGVGLAYQLSAIFGYVVFGGLFIDVVIYTMWLKRKTAWSIVWGGLSGGMPILAGRALGTGTIDTIGILLTLAILLWIPTHILTFSIKYKNDYAKAGIPTFPSTYGIDITRKIIALSSIFAAASIGTGALALGLSWGYLRLLAILSVGIVGLAVLSIFKPSEKINFGLFKYASIYMLGSMMMLSFGL